MRVVAALASLWLFAKAFDWLRLFSATAFFIRLLEETIYDISFFVVLLILSLIVFTFPFLLISLNWTYEKGYSGFEQFEKNLFLTYLTMLGEFPIEDWNALDGPYLWLNKILFVIATAML